MSDRWMDEREELERMDRERGYGRYRGERDESRHERGLYGDRSFKPRRDERVFGERESGVDYTSPRNSGDYAYEARMARRVRRDYADYARREPRGDDYAPITRGGSYAYARPHGGPDHWGEERGYRVAYGDHHPDHAGHYEDERDRRGFWERASDRVASWLGEGDHRGRGPTGYKRTDAKISEDAHDRLTDDPWLDASGIAIQVEGGEVTLSGTVAEREGKHRAERLVEDLAGVTHVQNNLRVRRNDPITGSGTGFGDSANATQISSANRKN
jgi:osmotically-inducible protein OsmY